GPGPVIPIDYEVRGLTSGDWPLFGNYFYMSCEGTSLGGFESELRSVVTLARLRRGEKVRLGTIRLFEVPTLG
ncbi:hypothetical protein, partial [Rhodopirellula sallentina]